VIANPDIFYQANMRPQIDMVAYHGRLSVVGANAREVTEVTVMAYHCSGIQHNTDWMRHEEAIPDLDFLGDEYGERP
jgi:hypothetical protein